eukprot:4844730-Prymnesium_polylepis.1
MSVHGIVSASSGLMPSPHLIELTLPGHASLQLHDASTEAGSLVYQSPTSPPSEIGEIDGGVESTVIVIGTSIDRDASFVARTVTISCPCGNDRPSKKASLLMPTDKNV